jgi:HAD superfamily hydrolase (TIGR01484 family)
MPYRLLAVDLDGTLLRADGSIDGRDVAAIGELQAAGVTVTIVTGRLRSGSLAAAGACGIGGAIACVEGSHLAVVGSGETLARHAMAPELTALLRETFAACGLASFVFEADVIHHDAAGEEYAAYISVWSRNLRVVEAALAEEVWAGEPLAAVAIGGPAAVAAALEVLRRRGAAAFAVSFEVRSRPGRHALLVRVAGPTKGTALRELCRVAGCSLDEAVAVGDWINDVPMFEVAGRSFAMQTAPEVVRAAAGEVLAVAAGAGGGIAEAIRRAWG